MPIEPLPTTEAFVPAEPPTVPPAAGATPWPAVPGVQILGELGRGGMGVVFRGRDGVFSRDLAVKILRGQADPDLTRRFLMEARLTGQLQHPGIVPVHTLGDLADGGPYFTMKLVEGRTLAALLKDRHPPANGRGSPADLPQFVQWFAQVCQTIGFAHSLGVIHRDLKPANVMVGGFGEVQVMDWGLAKQVVAGEPNPPGPPSLRGKEGDPLGDVGESAPPLQADLPPSPLRGGGAGGGGVPPTQAGALLGTPAYMAPEQARGEPVDARADVFALGAILCEILTGKPPYPGPASAVAAQAAAGDLAAATAALDACGADPELVGLARQCLAADPAGRPADGGAVAAMVVAYQAGVQARLQAAEVARAAAAERWAGERRARRLLAAVAGTGLVGAAVSLAFGLLAGTQREAALHAERQAEGRRLAAEAAEGQAFQAFENLTGEAAQKVWTRMPQLDVDQQQSLERAVAFFQKAAAAAGPDTAGRARAARAQDRAGALLRILGKREAALAVVTQAREGRQALAAAHPENPQYAVDLANTWTLQGSLLKDLERPEGSLAAHRQAQTGWRQLAQDHPADPGYAHGLANTTTNVALALQHLGRRDAAHAAYQDALALHQRLVRENRGNTGYAADLGKAWINLGTLLKEMGQVDAALAAFVEARALQEQLPHDLPAATETAADLALSWYNLGLVYTIAAKWEEALAAYTRSQDLRRHLRDTFPGVPQHAHDLAITLANRAAVLSTLGRRDAALANLVEAQEIQERQVRAFPASTPYTHALATTCYNLGNLHRDLGRRDAALIAFNRAKELDQRLVKTPPAPPEIAKALAMTLNNLANLHRDLGHADQALAGHTEALALWRGLVRDHPATPEFARGLAHTWFNLGNLLGAENRGGEAVAAYQAAADIRRQLLHDHPDDPEAAVDLAGVECNLAGLLKKRGQSAEALALYGQAAGRLRPALDQSAVRAAARRFARNTHWGRADTLSALGRYAEAVADWDQALTLNDEAQYTANLRRFRAIAVVAAALAQDHAWPLLWGRPIR